MPFPGLSSSGDQVLGKNTLPRWGGESFHFPGPSCSVSWVCSESDISGVLCVSSGELISGVTLLADVNRLGSQEDLVSNWEPACSLVEHAISAADFAPRLLAQAVARQSLCLLWGEGLVHSRLALLWYALSVLFCELVRQCFRLELLAGKFSLSPPFFILSGYPSLGCYLRFSSVQFSHSVMSDSL